MFFKIKNSFDSHCHFLATGQIASALSLKDLKSPDDVTDLKIESHHYQGEWLTGFGWDQNNWNPSEFPNKTQLDKYFPDFPVLFSRADGHASWINSKGLEHLKAKGFNGSSAGILLEEEHIAALMMLPPISGAQIRSFVMQSQRLFNAGGFTHARDLSMTLPIWNEMVLLGEKKELSIYLESFCTIEDVEDLDRAFRDIEVMKKNPSPYLRLKGIKVFFDGSLGSKTAFLSEPYLGSMNCGKLNWKTENLEIVMRKTWQNNLEFAVHTIGDAAVHEVVTTARKISAEGILGRLHLEHVQILRPETLQMMKPLHVTCHMQPCHWLSDHAWLSKAISPRLVSNSFSWEALRRNKIQLQFGSDSPIEPTSIALTEKALRDSAEAGWPKLNDDWTRYHGHSDPKWGECFTEMQDGQVSKVVFDGKLID